MDEVEDPVSGGVEAGDEGRPRHRALGRHGRGQRQVNPPEAARASKRGMRPASISLGRGSPGPCRRSPAPAAAGRPLAPGGRTRRRRRAGPRPGERRQPRTTSYDGGCPKKPSRCMEGPRRPGTTGHVGATGGSPQRSSPCTEGSAPARDDELRRRDRTPTEKPSHERATAPRDDELVRDGRRLTEEILSLHVGRRLDAEEAQDRHRDVQQVRVLPVDQAGCRTGPRAPGRDRRSDRRSSGRVLSSKTRSSVTRPRAPLQEARYPAL